MAGVPFGKKLHGRNAMRLEDFGWRTDRPVVHCLVCDLECWLILKVEADALKLRFLIVSEFTEPFPLARSDECILREEIRVG